MGHTPGPWVATKVEPPTSTHPLREFRIEHQGGYCQIATVQVSVSSLADWYAPAKDLEANAALIAAAPDLLEALIAARKELEEYEVFVTGEDYNNPALNAAIAKATP